MKYILVPEDDFINIKSLINDLTKFILSIKIIPSCIRKDFEFAVKIFNEDCNKYETETR